MAILDRFRRPARKALDNIAFYYLSANGRFDAIKSSDASSLVMGAYSAYASTPVSSTPQGYAYASIVSVWAARCIALKATTLARMDYRVVNIETRKEVKNHPLTVAIKRSKQRIIRKIEWSKNIWGETFLWPLQNVYGYTSDIYWLNNLGVQVDTAPGYIRGFIYAPTNGGVIHKFGRDQLCFMYTDNPFDELRGLSPLESVLIEVGIDKDIARMTKAFYSNDARIGLILVPENDLGVKEAQAFMDYFRANWVGTKNAGKPVLMPHNIKEIKDAQRAPITDDVTLRESVRREICAAFGVPLTVAGAWDAATYQSAPEERKSFYEETMMAEAEEVQRDITQHLLPYYDDTEENEFEFVPDKLLALTENTAEKVTTLNSKLTSGGITLNEWREEQELPPLERGNVLYVPTGVTATPLDKLGDPAPQPASPFGMQNGGYEISQPEPPALLTDGAQLQKQETADEELNAWERKALNNGAKKAIRFVAMVLDEEIQYNIRSELAANETADKRTLRAIFARAREQLKKTKAADTSICVMVELGSNPELLFLQKRTQQLFADESLVEWSNPDSFHVTLLYSDSSTQEQVSSLSSFLKTMSIELPSIEIGVLDAFESEGEQKQFAIIYHVKASKALLDLQKKIYEQSQQIGFEVSPYSIPSAYQPHITVAYSPVKPSSLIEGKNSVSANAIILNVAENTVYRKPLKTVKATDEPVLEDALDFWRDYDALQAEIGQEWVNSYMAQALATISKQLSGGVNNLNLDSALDTQQENLVNAWVGTEEQPGALTALVLAGMGAGQAALTQGSAANPHRPVAKAITLDVDWSLLSRQALEFVRTYAFNLIKRLDATTKEEVQKAITAWMESGAPLSKLKKALVEIFKSPVRAEMIAETESTRAYFEGSAERYRQAGVTKVKWHTVNAGGVCAICLDLNGKVGDLEKGWYSNVTKRYEKPPAHTRCRCYGRPVLDD